MALTAAATRTALVAGFPTATLHEAAGRVGDLPAAIKPIEPTLRVAGPAFPVRCPPGSNLHLHHAVREAERGDVLVVDVGTGYEWGYWGEILSEAALAAGLAGLVIHGCVRDRTELLAAGFPVFSTGLCIRGTDKLTDGGALGEPVRIGEVTVQRGDVVVGDVDGVVVLGSATVAPVAAAAAAREAKERTLIEAIRRGASTIDLYGFPCLSGRDEGVVRPS